MDTIAIINEAAQHKDWLTLALGSVALVTMVALKAFGKQIPVVDAIIAGVLRFLPAIKKAPAPTEQPGVSAVVEVKEKAAPQEELK